MDHKALCTKVLEIEPHVRFSGILNSRGDLAVQSNRNGGELLTAFNNNPFTHSLHSTA